MDTEQPPHGSESRTFICTVVFVDLVDSSRRPVAQQVITKRYLNELISRALAHVAEPDRLVLDTGDGAALCFFGDPEDALFAAANLRDAVKAQPGPGAAQVRIGINLGPARLIRDVNGNRNIIGDGINTAQRVMGFAVPNQILASRSYYEVVSHISAEYHQLFQYAGLHRDKHVRDHELYEMSGASTTAPGGARTADSEQTSFAPELLARVTQALTGHLGPVAKLIVQRASLHARDSRQLVAAVADSLTGNVREAFLVEVSGVTEVRSPAAAPAPAGVQAPASATGSAPGTPRDAGSVTPQMLAAAEERLARHVGPIARLLVAQAANEVTDVDRLVERLATHIEDSAARQAFVRAMHQGGAR